MFKKLRIKFIAITMAMVAVVMALAFTAACFSEYQRASAVVQTALSDAIDAASSDAGRVTHGGQAPWAGSSSASSEASSASSALLDSNGDTSSETGSSGSSQATAGRQVEQAIEKSANVGGESVQGILTEAYPQDSIDTQTSSQDSTSLTMQESASAQEASGNAGNTQGAFGQQGQAAPSQPAGEQGQYQGGSETQGQGQYQPQGQGSQTAQPGQQTAGQGEGAPGAEGQGASTNPDTASQASSSQGADNQASAQGSSANGPQPTGQQGQRAVEQGWMQVQEDGTVVEIESPSQSEESVVPPMIGRREEGQKASSSLVPVAVFEIESDGFIHMIPQVTTASISQDVLRQAAQELVGAEEGSGVLGNLDLHYLKRAVGERTFMAFADTSYTDSWKSLAFMLVISGLVTLALFFIVCLFYSRWALRPVREAWDSQRQFVADASHDLKTPLTVILANASILLKHPERTIAQESQWVESTQHEAQDMQQLVNEMLELAQIEAGEQVEIAKEKIDFSDLVNGETLLFDSVSLERMCTFDCDIQDGVQVLGDEKRLKKMVSTLLENAFKYVDDNGTVDVSLKASGRAVRLSIRNTGSIISPEDLPHIFDRFYRTDKARTSGAGGFGLGLAIARGVALQLGGDITCASDESSGTTFTVTLPVAN